MTTGGIDRALEKKGVALAVLIFVSIAAYFPALHAYYLHTDDYFWSHWGGFSNDSVLWFMTIIGRPLAGFLFCLGATITTVTAINAVRFASVVNLAILGWLIFKWLRIWRIPALLSLSLSVMVITLPPFQTYVAYVCTSVFGLAVTLAMAALFPALAAGRSKTPLGCSALAVLLLITSLCLYQPATLFFLAMLAVPVVLSDGSSFIRDWRKPLLIHGSILFSSMLIYYFFWRLWYLAYNVASGGKYDARNISTDYGSRLGWFVTHPLFEAINLWDVSPGILVLLLVTAIILAGIVADFINTRQSKQAHGDLGANFAAKYLVLLLMIPASYAINFVSGDTATNYRTFCALSPVLLVIVVPGTFHLAPAGASATRKAILASLLYLLALGGIWEAHHSVEEYFVRPDSAEFNHLKAIIADHVRAKGIPESIHVILPLPSVGTSTQRNEFGEITLRHPPNIRPAVAAALHELGIDRDIPVTLSEPAAPDIWFEFETHFRDKDLLPFRVPTNPSGNVLIIDRSAFP